MRVALFVVIGLTGLAAVAVLAAALIGSRLPRDHVATGSALVSGPLQEVYDRIATVEAAPTWRSGVRDVRVERTSADGRRIEYVERAEWGTIRYAAEGAPPRRFRTEILGEDQPFGGSWTFDLEAAGTDTKVTVTERGFVDNPFFRFVSRFVLATRPRSGGI
ncbi:MAG: SRPBCC family protein [Thermoanaerobaculia bacterium]